MSNATERYSSIEPTASDCALQQLLYSHFFSHNPGGVKAKQKEGKDHLMVTFHYSLSYFPDF